MAHPDELQLATTPHDSSKPSKELLHLGALLVPLAAWLAIYPTRIIIGHTRFATNAYDLSVFDYALWSTLRGDLGHVPFMNQSLFSHHFMVTLLALLPGYALLPSPMFLITVQLSAFAGAAVLLWLLAKPQLPPLVTGSLILAFLFGRRSHSAIAGVFYVESLEPLLIFGLLVAWQRCRWSLYWVLLVFALGCKEDMPLYVLIFGALQWWRGERRTGTLTSALAACWLIVAVTLAVPAARGADGLPTANPFWEDRLSSSPGSVVATDVVSRVLSPRTAERLVLLVASAGFLPLAAPAWLVVALPGSLLNFAARPDSVQAGLTGHYLWPVLPWIFFSAVVGAHRLQLKKPAVVTTIAVLLAAATIADSPLWVGLRRGFSVSSSTAAEMRAALRTIPSDAPVLAMPNLIPHLPHRSEIFSIGVNEPSRDQEWVALTVRGDLWPLDAQRVQRLMTCYIDAPAFERMSERNASVVIFRRRGAAGVAPTCPAPSP